MEDAFPRRACPTNSRYMIHKVSTVLVNDRGMLQFTYETKSGVTSQGPCYLGSASGPTLAADALKKRTAKPRRDQLCDRVSFRRDSFRATRVSVEVSG